MPRQARCFIGPDVIYRIQVLSSVMSGLCRQWPCDRKDAVFPGADNKLRGAGTLNGRDVSPVVMNSSTSLTAQRKPSSTEKRVARRADWYSGNRQPARETFPRPDAGQSGPILGCVHAAFAKGQLTVARPAARPFP